MSQPHLEHATSVPHIFDRAIALQPQANGTWHGHTSTDYANMIGPFGGVTAATALQALLIQPERLGDPVALTVNFAGPVRDGGFEVRVRLMRSSRSTQHWSVDMVQGDDCVINAIAVFALRRPTWSATEIVMPEVVAADTLTPVGDIMGVRWPQCYDMRFARGGLRGVDGAGDNPDSLTHLWINDKPPRPLDFASLTAICDAFFPRLFSRRAQMVPIGTVSLNIHFHADAATLAQQGSAPVLGVAQGQIFNLGFSDQVAHVWSAQGRLLATSQQAVWFKE
ncbi:thioesterase family protein [Actimicrobium sp. CCC2.4]|uniref:acyl-CoA thioesterase n=1 Tax=Actimicrobium sp. CCC2.4 TaxID=3048606 RepID=UPI002AC9A116|nr:thioesterase family protein [Actimicrobium sp. CCC2.4]MEB0135967.1 thioesterase family protein [Actimicrobium sp. CCC2.4]WPX32630.1 thioesterase family protein [Actimicrobium sp. CCC2.4]